MFCVFSHPRKITQCWCGLILFWFFSPSFPYGGMSTLMNNGSKSQNLLLSSLHVPWGCLTQGRAAFIAVGGSSVVFLPFHLPAPSAATFHQPDFLGRQRMCDHATNPHPGTSVGRHSWEMEGKKKCRKQNCGVFFPLILLDQFIFSFIICSAGRMDLIAEAH